MKLLRIFQFAFGSCHHSHLSRVFTIDKRTYQVCFECGQEFDYSWALMRRIRPSVANAAYAALNSTRHARVPVVQSPHGAGVAIRLLHNVSYLAQTPKPAPVILYFPECVVRAATADS